MGPPEALDLNFNHQRRNTFMNRTFRELHVWQRSVDFCADLYAMTASFPPAEATGLTAEIRRVAVAIPGHIAEGESYRDPREFVRLLRITIGQLQQLESHLAVATRLGYCDIAKLSMFSTRADELGRMLAALIRSQNRNVGGGGKDRRGKRRDGKPGETAPEGTGEGAASADPSTDAPAVTEPVIEPVTQ
jgi:four helix bundle protein